MLLEDQLYSVQQSAIADFKALSTLDIILP